MIATLAPFTTAAAFFVMAWAACELLPAFIVDVADLWADLRADFGDVHSEEN